MKTPFPEPAPGGARRQSGHPMGDNTNARSIYDQEDFVVQCERTEPEPATRRFGPFEVPSDEVQPAGFGCLHCKRPVEVVRQLMSAMVPRLCVYACRCGAIVVWEDECQPDQRLWWHNVKLLKAAKVKVAIFNGNKPLSPGFGGLS